MKCQKLALETDPDWAGTNPAVSECFDKLEIDDHCASVEGAAENANFGWYDIAHPLADPTPEPYIYGYLHQEHILAALGVPVNYTSASPAVSAAFQSTADIARAGSMQAVAYLLESGVKVHMMYGDRDYACNWLGGEAASLAIPYVGQEDFASAGYAPIVGAGGVGGFVRQYGNFSFSRVFQAGHEGEFSFYIISLAFIFRLNWIVTLPLPSLLLPGSHSADSQKSPGTHPKQHMQSSTALSSTKT